jgi:hypothetical protein
MATMMPATRTYLLGTRLGGLYSSKKRSSQVSSLLRCGFCFSRGGARALAVRSFLWSQHTHVRWPKVHAYGLTISAGINWNKLALSESEKLTGTARRHAHAMTIAVRARHPGGLCKAWHRKNMSTAGGSRTHTNLSLLSNTGIFTRSSGPSFSLGASMMNLRLAACCLIFLFGCVSSKLLYRLMQSCSLPVACMGHPSLRGPHFWPSCLEGHVCTSVQTGCKDQADAASSKDLRNGKGLQTHSLHAEGLAQDEEMCT